MANQTGQKEEQLPTGKWQIFGNMEKGELDITSVDGPGNVKGTALGDQISGAFHAASGEIHFSRKMGIDRFQTYSGHLSIVSIGVDAPQYLLAGSYFSFPFPKKPRYGWYATITKPIVGRG